MSWPLVAIKDVAKVITGKTPSKLEDDNFGGEIPFITPSELSGSIYVSDSPQTITEKGASKLKLVPRDAVMVCCIGSLGKLAIAAREVATNQQINSVIFDKDKVYPKYGYYCLSRLKPIMESLASSTTIAIINKSNFESLEIPLPSLTQQKRIADILDKADAIRHKRQQVLRITDELLHAVFLDMFGNPVTNSKGWMIVSLGDVLESIESGKSPRCETRRAAQDEWGVLKLGAVTKCNYLVGENKAVLPDFVPDPRYEVKKNDLLFTRKNTYELVAAVALVEDTRSKLLLPDLIFRLNTNNRVDKYFLWKLLSNRSMRSKVQSLASGAAGSMPNISQANLKKLNIILPPIEKQRQFQNICKDGALLKNRVEQFVNDQSDLFASLNQQAFSGRL